MKGGFGRTGFINFEVVLMATLDSLSQVKVPSIFAKIQAKGLMETMDIIALTNSQDAGGANKKAESTAYSSVPVSIKKQTNRYIPKQVGEKFLSYQEYLLTFPTHQSGTRINFDIKTHRRLKILARGHEPETFYEVESIAVGVMYGARCTKVD
jgi:hypothetical protein